MTRAEALREARSLLLRADGCGHELVCADPGCRAAGHEHENYGEDGWSCGEDCHCSPACLGHGPDVCADAAELRDLVASIDRLLAKALRRRRAA